MLYGPHENESTAMIWSNGAKSSGIESRQREPNFKTSAEMVSEKRNLRSASDTKIDKTLFNFDSANRLLYDRYKFKISTRIETENLYDSNSLKFNTESTGRPLNVVKRNHLLPRRSKNKAEILPDELYNLYHKRMQKEEKKMTNIDREKIMVEVDKLNNQWLLLTQHDWQKYLPTITHLNDARDPDELLFKQKLTLKEIRMLLSKFHSWKRREETLLQRLRSFTSTPKDDDLTDHEEDALSVSSLKKKRFKERCRKYGPVINLRINRDLVLVIDPVLPPRFIESPTKVPRKPLNSSHTKIKKEEHVNFQPDEEVSFKVPRSFRSDPILNLAFGEKIPSLQEKVFTIPVSWRNKYRNKPIE